MSLAHRVALACWEAVASAPDDRAAVVSAAARSLGPVPATTLVVLLTRGNQATVDVISAPTRDEHAPAWTRAPLVEALASVLASAAREELATDLPESIRRLAERPSVTAVALYAHERALGVALLGGERPLDEDGRAALIAVAAPLAHAIHIRERLDRLRALELEKEALQRRLPNAGPGSALVGEHGGLREVVARVKQVAATDLPVLLLGETGSGKEVVARLVHDRSPRRQAAFHRVNCGAIAPDLVDSELFGHERGAFTGAASTRQGWFERADGGTLFLDEVGELPLAAQVRLLQVLQDGTFERVGGQKSMHVDVRIVAATHRDLHGMVADGSFREDLWYRVSSFQIFIPPLRRRTGDLEALTEHFVQRASRRFGVAVPAWTNEDIEALGRYRWPGNVREFAAVIDRAVLLAADGYLDVSAALGAPPPPRTIPPPAFAHTPATASTQPAAEAVGSDDVSAARIAAELRATFGRVEGPFGAAARLGVNPHTLRSRMRRLGIDPRAFRREKPSR